MDRVYVGVSRGHSQELYGCLKESYGHGVCRCKWDGFGQSQGL